MIPGVKTFDELFAELSAKATERPAGSGTVAALDAGVHDIGKKVVEEAGQPSRSVSVRRLVYDAKGKLLFDTTWYSNYVAEAKVVRVGTKAQPVESTTTKAGQASP